MLIDTTGATAAIMSSRTYSSLWQNPLPLQKQEARLKTYTGEEVPILGSECVHAGTLQTSVQAATIAHC